MRSNFLIISIPIVKCKVRLKLSYFIVKLTGYTDHNVMKE